MTDLPFAALPVGRRTPLAHRQRREISAGAQGHGRSSGRHVIDLGGAA